MSCFFLNYDLFNFSYLGLFGEKQRQPSIGLVYGQRLDQFETDHLSLSDTVPGSAVLRRCLKSQHPPDLEL